MSLWKVIEKEAESTKSKATQDSSEELNVITKAMSLYGEGFSHAKPSEDMNLAMARMGLVSQNFNSLKLAIESACTGYYPQTFILLRNVYENWLSFWYLAKFPDEVDRWLDPRWDMRPPKAETMRNRIDHPSKQTKNRLHGFYEELNRFAHTDPIAVLSRIKVVDGVPGIHVGVEYRKEDFLACIYGLALWVGNMLDAIGCWIPDDHEWKVSYEEVMEDLILYLNWYSDMEKCAANRSPPASGDAARFANKAV